MTKQQFRELANKKLLFLIGILLLVAGILFYNNQSNTTNNSVQNQNITETIIEREEYLKKTTLKQFFSYPVYTLFYPLVFYGIFLAANEKSCL